jgi:hypothetical protein
MSQRDGGNRVNVALRRFPPRRRHSPPATSRDTRDLETQAAAATGGIGETSGSGRNDVFGGLTAGVEVPVEACDVARFGE